MSSDLVNSLLEALLHGLEDYTIDERCDVGSWVRIASIQGLTKISSLLMDRSGDMAAEFEKYFPPEVYQRIVAGILKQGVERLDNVRQEAGRCVMLFLQRPLLNLPGGGDGGSGGGGGAKRWVPHNSALLRRLFNSPGDAGTGWQDGVWLFPRAFRILEIPEYRVPVLSGLLLSIGSRTDSIQKPVADSLVKFAQKLPLTGGAYSLTELIVDLINHAKASMTSNTIVIPVFQAFNVLFDQRALDPAVNDPNGFESLETLLSMASKNIDRMKNIQRIHEAMKVVVNILAFEPIRREKISVLREFLGHPFPRIRADTAEFLFTLFQIQDFGPQADDVESLLLETEWVGDISVAKEKAEEVVSTLSGS